MAAPTNIIGKVNEHLSIELERLNHMSDEDPEALRLEISRARAVERLTSTAISSANVILEVARMKADLSGSKVNISKLLED